MKQVKRGEFVVNGKFNVSERISKWTGYVELNNCKDSLNYNMCYKYFNMSADFCELFDGASEFLQQVTPILKCPLEKTVYTITDLPVKDDVINYMPSLDETSYWTVVIPGFDGSKMVSCLNVQFQMSVRRRGG